MQAIIDSNNYFSVEPQSSYLFYIEPWNILTLFLSINGAVLPDNQSDTFKSLLTLYQNVLTSLLTMRSENRTQQHRFKIYSFSNEFRYK